MFCLKNRHQRISESSYRSSYIMVLPQRNSYIAVLSRQRPEMTSTKFSLSRLIQIMVHGSALPLEIVISTKLTVVFRHCAAGNDTDELLLTFILKHILLVFNSSTWLSPHFD